MARRKPIVFVTYNRDKDWYEIQNRDRELIVAYPFKRCEADISPHQAVHPLRHRHKAGRTATSGL